MAVKTDCVHYICGIQGGSKEWERCNALKKVYCRKEECSWYKKKEDKANEKGI